MASRRLTRLLRGPGSAAASSIDSAFRLLFDGVEEGLALLDDHGRMVLANAALARMAGPAVALAPGLPVERLVAPAARDALRDHLRHGQAPALHVAPADPAAPADAEWALRVRRLPAAARGGSALLLLSATDRTEQRRAAQHLAASARLETVGRLAGGIAHDFNNLLAAILGAVAAAREAGLPPAAALELTQIEEAATRGAALVRQVLAVARQQRLEPRVIDLRRALEEMAPLLRRLMGREIAVELALQAEAAPVRVDPAQFDQMLLNLAANAKEAMGKGGRLRLVLSRAVVLRQAGEGPVALPPGRYAVLDVVDNGCGIPPEVLPHLFEPFFTTRPDRGGTGLGLATVQGIVAQSGGHIAVQSAPGEGTCFRIHLPRAEMPLPETAPDPVPMLQPGSSGAASLARPLLLVDDEPALCRLSARLLERAGYAVRVADCAETALEMTEAEAEPPLALISDVAMPGIDGLTLARRLRGRWPGLPVLLLSGYAESLLGEDLAAAGIAFLAKPFATGDLVAEVAGLVGQG
jgi:two-component system cell cycle sensor histidine kinase/response regulator CckA